MYSWTINKNVLIFEKCGVNVPSWDEFYEISLLLDYLDDQSLHSKKVMVWIYQIM